MEGKKKKKEGRIGHAQGTVENKMERREEVEQEEYWIKKKTKKERDIRRMKEKMRIGKCTNGKEGGTRKRDKRRDVWSTRNRRTERGKETVMKEKEDG